MLEMIRVLLSTCTGRENFLALVQMDYNAEETAEIMFAHDFAERVFRRKYREGGERYFTHLEGTAIIVMCVLRLLGVHSVEAIVTALLHDILEDFPDEWTILQLGGLFGSTIVILVQWVSKRDVEYYHGDKNARDREFNARLFEAPFEAAVPKLADRLHNLITIWPKSKESQEQKVAETKRVYYKLALQHGVLYHELRKAVRDVKRSWTKRHHYPQV